MMEGVQKSFRSTWAKEMKELLRKAVESAEKTDNTERWKEKEYPPRREEEQILPSNWEHKTPETWEQWQEEVSPWENQRPPARQ